MDLKGEWLEVNQGKAESNPAGGASSRHILKESFLNSIQCKEAEELLSKKIAMQQL